MERFKICPQCGHENLPNAADCVQCQADILAEPIESRAPAEKPAAEPQAPHLVLECFTQPDVRFSVFEDQVVGRSTTADVMLKGVPELDSVSRRMALFTRRGEQWYVRHIAETNFIVVDGETVDAEDDVALHDGSVLGLALAQFFVRIPQEAR